MDKDSRYQKKFSLIRDNCKTKSLDLEKNMCKPSHKPLVGNYNNLVDDVEASLSEFLAGKNDSKNLDSTFNKYEEDCNKYYSLVRGKIYQDCKFRFFTPMNILLIVLLISSIFLGFLGFRSENKNTKIIYFSIAGILILTTLVLFFFNLRKIFN